jgi:hypothetical protein
LGWWLLWLLNWWLYGFLRNSNGLHVHLHDVGKVKLKRRRNLSIGNWPSIYLHDLRKFKRDWASIWHGVNTAKVPHASCREAPAISPTTAVYPRAGLAVGTRELITLPS